MISNLRSINSKQKQRYMEPQTFDHRMVTIPIYQNRLAEIWKGAEKNLLVWPFLQRCYKGHCKNNASSIYMLQAHISEMKWSIFSSPYCFTVIVQCELESKPKLHWLLLVRTIRSDWATNLKVVPYIKVGSGTDHLWHETGQIKVPLRKIEF